MTTITMSKHDYDMLIKENEALKKMTDCVLVEQTTMGIKFLYVSKINDVVLSQQKEIIRLKSRNLWQRIINK